MFENVTITDLSRQALEESAADRRIPHAVILEGTDAKNRLEAAYNLATAAVCNGDRPPCMVCSNCRKAAHKTHQDIIVMAKPEKRAMFSVEDVRSMKTDAYIVPGEGENKVYIISEAQYLNVASQNTLLKLIEEPPPKAMFILTCPSVSYLLETVRSRAPSYFLGEIPPASDEEDGMQTAYSLLKALCSSNEADFMAETASMEKDKNFFVSVLGALEICLRDVLTVKNGGKTVLTDGVVINKISPKLSSAKVLDLMQKIRQLEDEVQYNVNQNLAITRLCSMMFSKGW